MSITELEILAELKDEVRRRLPSGKTVFEQARDQELGDRAANAKWIKLHFSQLVEQIQSTAYKVYLEAERPAVAEAIRAVFVPLLSEQPSIDEFFGLFRDFFHAFDRLFLGLTQGRRPRAGKAFEHVIKLLFTTLEYPYTPQAIIRLCLKTSCFAEVSP